MPESRHRRKGKRRPRPQEVHGPPVKPEPSSPWVPRTGVGLILAGTALIIITYIPGLVTANWMLLVGFGAMAAGFAVLMRWH